MPRKTVIDAVISLMMEDAVYPMTEDPVGMTNDYSGGEESFCYTPPLAMAGCNKRITSDIVARNLAVEER